MCSAKSTGQGWCPWTGLEAVFLPKSAVKYNFPEKCIVLAIGFTCIREIKRVVLTCSVFHSFFK